MNLITFVLYFLFLFFLFFLLDLFIVLIIRANIIRIIIIAIIALIIYALSNLFFNRLSYKLYFFICLYFPIFLFSVICFQRENILSVLKYTFSFFKNRNIYFYKKKHFNIVENSKKDK